MEEDNKLIVKFMELDKKILSAGNIHSWSDAPFYYTTENSKEKVLQHIIEYSKYYSSWDWLHPVIRKIINTIGVKTIDDCDEEEWYQSTRITRMYIGIDIETAHHYVVEWIKWYNNKINEQ